MSTGWAGKGLQSLNVPHSQREKSVRRGYIMGKAHCCQEAYLVVFIFPAMSRGYNRAKKQ